MEHASLTIIMSIVIALPHQNASHSKSMQSITVRHRTREQHTRQQHRQPQQPHQKTSFVMWHVLISRMFFHRSKSMATSNQLPRKVRIFTQFAPSCFPCEFQIQLSTKTFLILDTTISLTPACCDTMLNHAYVNQIAYLLILMLMRLEEWIFFTCLSPSISLAHTRNQRIFRRKFMWIIIIIYVFIFFAGKSISDKIDRIHFKFELIYGLYTSST